MTWEISYEDFVKGCRSLSETDNNSQWKLTVSDDVTFLASEPSLKKDDEWFRYKLHVIYRLDFFSYKSIDIF